MLTDLQKRKLTKLFSMYDSDYTGVLGKKDFELIGKKISTLCNWSKRSPRCIVLEEKLMQKWEGLEKKADTHHNAEISIDEWYAYYDDVLADAQACPEMIAELLELIFDAFDQDADGQISQVEWGQLLAIFNESPVYAPLIFPTLDQDHDGYLTKSEIRGLFINFCYSDDPDELANQMFGPY
ncbi:MAG: calcium-binding protein [Leptolyngbya sp. SIOISBB]|nr:calcium-binding protein [Leptolyngbya sp. SIOISBB]